MKKEEHMAVERMIRELRQKPQLMKAQRETVQYHAEKRRIEEQRNRKNELNRIIDEVKARRVGAPEHYKRRKRDLEKMIKDSLPYL